MYTFLHAGLLLLELRSASSD